MQAVFVVILLSLGLFGCTTPTKGPGPLPPVSSPFEQSLAEAEQAVQVQDYARAAALFRTLAEQQPSPQHEKLLLRSADAELSAGNSNVQLVRNTLATLAQANFSGDDALLLQVLQAELAVLDGQYAAVPWDPATAVLPDETADPVLRWRFYHALLGLNPPLVLRVQTLLALDNVLSGEAERVPVQLDALRTLHQLDAARLRELATSGEMPGWVQLVVLSQQYSNDLSGLQAALPAWEAQFPAHPAMLEPLLAQWHAWFPVLEQPRQVAVLLPQTGRYAPPAQALREGILLSLDGLPETQRPVVQFYDTTADLPIAAVYQQAVSDGADWVIGPLRKQAVSELLQLAELPVAVLALNQVTTLEVPANMTMFSLNPEDEARQAAERIWLDGKRQPMVLVPENAWGQRLLDAFQARWLVLNDGIDLVYRQYNPKSYDHGKVITDLLLIEQSKQRHRRLQTLIKRKLEFEPRRRSDVDAIFLAARGSQAQGFAPQLKFHLAGDLPLYTTSHIWQGQLSKRQLADMRGIFVPDIPLLTTEGAREAVLGAIPDWQPALVRLYALGMDALVVLPHLARLRTDTAAVWDGQTGLLSMDTEHRLYRHLAWIQLDEPIRLIAPAAPMPLVDSAVSMEPMEGEATYAP